MQSLPDSLRQPTLSCSISGSFRHCRLNKCWNNPLNNKIYQFCRRRHVTRKSDTDKTLYVDRDESGHRDGNGHGVIRHSAGVRNQSTGARAQLRAKDITLTLRHYIMSKIHVEPKSGYTCTPLATTFFTPARHGRESERRRARNLGAALDAPAVAGRRSLHFLLSARIRLRRLEVAQRALGLAPMSPSYEPIYVKLRPDAATITVERPGRRLSSHAELITRPENRLLGVEESHMHEARAQFKFGSAAAGTLTLRRAHAPAARRHRTTTAGRERARDVQLLDRERGRCRLLANSCGRITNKCLLSTMPESMGRERDLIYLPFN
ncbi:hypothetical protein EVAR_97355_1 [Eumeta japonica]|uniref:Uncharacterized protein n=1 Tax=Eumeta variegata TaxID=151549 RepID=A0A4C1YUH4_EUMVA|nr:hypothetical protein EVAR_97355_1 [Eumeta japonica]